MSREPLLDRRQILSAFELLGDKLALRDVVADVNLIGGAVMVLVYDARPSTAAIDAVWQPHGVVHDAALEVAEEKGLPRWWLNEQASAYIPSGPDWRRVPIFDHPNLRLAALAPEQLLAMKVMSGRPQDADDIVTIADELEMTDSDSVLDLTASVFPDDEIPARSRALLVDVLSTGSRK